MPSSLQYNVVVLSGAKGESAVVRAQNTATTFPFLQQNGSLEAASGDGGYGTKFVLKNLRPANTSPYIS